MFGTIFCFLASLVLGTFGFFAIIMGFQYARDWGAYCPQCGGPLREIR